MRKNFSFIIYIITITFLILLQTSFFPQLKIWNVKPDLVVLFVTSVGLLKGYKEGTVVGALAGILSGLISGNLWGLYIFNYSIIGFLSGLIPEKVEPDNIIIPFLSGIGASLAEALIIIIMGEWLELFFPTSNEFYNIITFLTWNGLFIVPVFLISKKYLITPGIDPRLRKTGLKSDYIIN